MKTSPPLLLLAASFLLLLLLAPCRAGRFRERVPDLADRVAQVLERGREPYERRHREILAVQRGSAASGKRAPIK